MDQLMAAYIEARVDVSTIRMFAAQAEEIAGAGFAIDAKPGDALWSRSEVLRINAGLVQSTGAANADKTAEKGLLESLELARSQSVLSFELRSAISLAQLWRRTGRNAKARGLLKPIYGRFTEGFATRDLLDARQLLDDLG
jgi:hypothetical protein